MYISIYLYICYKSSGSSSGGSMDKVTGVKYQQFDRLKTDTQQHSAQKQMNAQVSFFPGITLY